MDLLGLRLEQARRLAEQAGCRLEVSETRPPGKPESAGHWRVIRQLKTPTGWTVTVCRVPDDYTD
ncbi:MAG TPA: hypothetical protein GX726_01370 [Clostridiales bacterium]|jgi:hypothetical protein|nr:hypothetical protein [Clostridiales bacterium]